MMELRLAYARKTLYSSVLPLKFYAFFKYQVMNSNKKWSLTFKTNFQSYKILFSPSNFAIPLTISDTPLLFYIVDLEVISITHVILLF